MILTAGVCGIGQNPELRRPLICYLIFDVPEVAGLVEVFDFDVGEGGLVLWTVIDEFFAAINHTVVPHFFESLVDAVDDVFVEGEG